MSIRSELTLRLQNSPGAIARACQIVAGERINVLGIHLEAGGVLRLLVDNPLHAAGTLREQHFQVEVRDVLYTHVPNDPGALVRVSRLLADSGVNVEYLYCTVVEGEPMAAVVIGVPNAVQASASAGI